MALEQTDIPDFFIQFFEERKMNLNSLNLSLTDPYCVHQWLEYNIHLSTF